MDDTNADASPPHATLILLRHGQSTFNRERRFTGWSDAPLSPRGVAEALRAGVRLRHEGLLPDVVFTSLLSRARHTADKVVAGLAVPPASEASWRLNERHYGALEGLSIWQALRHFGPWLLWRCRRHFTTRPPSIDSDDPRHPRHDRRYDDVADEDLPRGESYADILARVQPYHRDRIEPHLRRGRTVLVVAHKNVIHLLLVVLTQQPLATIRRIPIGTATPIVLELDTRLHVLRRRTLA